MDMGPGLEQNIIRQALSAREPIPERIINAPQLLDGLQFELEAFFELDNERTHTFGLTQIPMSVIRNYAERRGLFNEECEEFIETIHRLDIAHLSRLETKRQKPDGSDKSRKSGK